MQLAETYQDPSFQVFSSRNFKLHHNQSATDKNDIFGKMFVRQCEVAVCAAMLLGRIIQSFIILYILVNTRHMDKFLHNEKGICEFYYNY